MQGEMASKDFVDDRWLSLGQVAALLNVTREAARQLVHRGTLPHRRSRGYGGGWPRIEVPRSAVEELQRDEAYSRRSRR